MTYTTTNCLHALLALTAITTSTVTAFSGVAVRQKINSPASRLPALIYGWDGQEEDTTTTSTSYLDVDSDLGRSCSPEGTALAEALSYDRDRAGHLARLAVAFSPPERALTLENIENVDVICVHDDSIDIQAIMCQDGGCVSLSVPVQFPMACYSSPTSAGTDQLQGCVLQNLEELDAQAGSILTIQQQQNPQLEYGEECELNSQFEDYPEWWIPPECAGDVALANDCATVQQLLNEAEFQADVNALAQDALRRISGGEDFKVLQAKVAIVGPAGICFKVRAEHETVAERPKHIIDVVHPFDQVVQDSETLRAAVLGAIAAAEGA